VPEKEMDGIVKALGYLTMNWPQYEVELFFLFSTLLGAGQAKAHGIWFSLVSLDLRLDLLSKLVERDVASVRDKKQIKAFIAEAKSHTKRRNRYVHRVWTREGSHMALNDLRRVPEKATRVTAKEIVRFVTEVGESTLTLHRFTKGTQGQQKG
jgi:hypothetical protein